ncbi:zinc finger protein-like protein [Leptotrombidium deliense]|uniref:Zinc finger protein-like protein n=1 Tax=Leptotrombidium deliense TaxID=299467 RepID=A0A443SNB9_9ACAR|nr:zinc finger protein-like protein [Leptotrombidium deliense]
MNGYGSYHSLNASGAALLHNDLMKSPHYSSSLLSPYLNQAYAAAAAINSIKAASVCRDPYCKGCQMSAASALNANAMSCANGCNGCVHSMHSHPLQPSFLPPSLASFAASPAAANAALQSAARPLVCNWTVAGQYCGKSFATCEELLQHLKSHTNANGSSPSPAAGIPGFGSYYPPAAGLPQSLASISALRSPPNHALDSYRYHPYKPSLPGSVQPPIAQHASAAHLSPLSGYYPTFNMYNGRL